MRSQTNIPGSVFRNALNIAEKMEPLKSKKNPTIAAIAAFALGGIGLAAYLRSWPDFYIPCLILLVLLILSLFTAGLPIFFIPFFGAFYAHRRVSASNAKLERRGSVEIVEAEIVTVRPPTIQIPARTQTPMETRLRQIDDLFQKGFLTPTERAERRERILAEL